jgi:hypothetical protein
MSGGDPRRCREVKRSRLRVSMLDKAHTAKTDRIESLDMPKARQIGQGASEN